jgi:peptidoglycan/xylan/chitin deacetylase (PgdA/CDA1 family)
MWGQQFPDLRTFTYRMYGERVGVFRILDLFERLGIKATIAVGSEIFHRYPRLIERCLANGHEIAAHGISAAQMVHSKMTESEELSHIQTAIEAVTRATGERPAGWFGQDQGESARTPFLLARSGFEYVADWPNDEQPYWMQTSPPLVSLPLQTELDDQQFLWLHQQASWTYPEAVLEAADRLAEDGRVQSQARTLCLGVRSWLSGRPHRIGHLARALEGLLARSDIWIAPGRDVVRAFGRLRTPPIHL